jgi:hypothetical protein
MARDHAASQPAIISSRSQQPSARPVQIKWPKGVEKRRWHAIPTSFVYFPTPYTYGERSFWSSASHQIDSLAPSHLKHSFNISFISSIKN